MKKSIKTKIGTLLLIVALVVTMVPTTLFADGEEVTEYDLYVAGVRITSENKDDVLGDGGTVKFNNETYTITLNNADIKLGVVHHPERWEHYSGIDINDNTRIYNIELIGKNKIYGNNQYSHGMGIFACEHSNLVIDGSGSLEIAVPDTYDAAYGIYTLEDSDILFEDSIDVNIFTHGAGILTNNISVMDEAKVKVESESTAVDMGQNYSMYDGSVIMSDTAIFEVECIGEDGKAFKRIDTEGGNIDDITGLLKESKYSNEYEYWDGDTDDLKLTDYKYVRFPFETDYKEIHYKKGDHGQGFMNIGVAYKGGWHELPKCEFEGLDYYEFNGWEIDGVVYHPGDRVTILDDTVVTATWIPSPLNIMIGGVQVTRDNASDVLGDGTVSVAQAEAPGGAPGIIMITLDNATIECDKRPDGEEASTEYGIKYNKGGNYSLQITLKGENKIINKKTYAGATGVEGIVTHSALSTTFMGDGTLDMNIEAQRRDGKYTGIHTLQQTNITKAKVNVCINGDYYTANKNETKAFYLESADQVCLSNKAELLLDSNYSYAFDNNSQTNADIDVEKGSKFQAKCKWIRTWGALHGNGWVTFTDSSKAQGVMVNELYSGEDDMLWDGTTEIGTYKKVLIYNDKPEPETTTAPVKPTVKPTVKPAVKAPAKAKVKKAVKKKKSSKKIKITLKKTKGAKGYQVAAYKKKKDAKKNKKVLKKKYVKKVKFTLTSKKFKKKKKLYVKARAYVLDGKAKVFGKWSKIKKVKTK